MLVTVVTIGDGSLLICSFSILLFAYDRDCDLCRETKNLLFLLCFFTSVSNMVRLAVDPHVSVSFFSILFLRVPCF